MTETLRAYVSRTPEGGWRVEGTRVSLDSVVHEFRDGESPEGIVEHYPSLALDQVYGAIAYYLSHRAEVDAYLNEQDALWERVRDASESQNAPLLQRLRIDHGCPGWAAMKKKGMPVSGARILALLPPSYPGHPRHPWFNYLL